MRAPIVLLLLAFAGLATPGRAQAPDFPAPDPVAEISAAIESGLAEERRLYWLKCSGARQSLRRSRVHALAGVGLFLANAPLEYAISHLRYRGQKEPAALNAAAFVLMGASLWNLAWARVHDARYEHGRFCCRLWQEYAGTERSGNEPPETLRAAPVHH